VGGVLVDEGEDLLVGGGGGLRGRQGGEGEEREKVVRFHVGPLVGDGSVWFLQSEEHGATSDEGGQARASVYLPPR
jgi:hypothetical protein